MNVPQDTSTSASPTTGSTTPPRPRRSWRVAAIVAALIGAAGAAWWLQHRSAVADAGGPPAAAAPPNGARNFGGAGRVQPVSVALVQRRDIRVETLAIGSIAAANTAIVRAKVGGELKSIHFAEGRPVRAGQLLAEIDPRQLQIALGVAQGTFERDQALLANAEIDLQRYRDLVAKDAAPKQQLDTQRALVQQLKGSLRTDQAGVDNAKLQLSYTRVVAPISGLAGLKQADLGNVVNAGDPNGLVSIAQTQPVAVVFAVPEARLARIREQLKAGVALPVEAWDRAQTSRLAIGRVNSTDNAIDPTTGTIRVKALFPNLDNALFPNQFVNVRLQLDTLAGSLAVPTAAVQRGAPGTFVYLVGADGTVRLKVVTTSATDGDWVAVQGELQPGDKVVTDGADRLRDGAKVEVIAPAVPGDARAAGAAGAKRGAASSAASGSRAAAASASGGPTQAAETRPRWMDRVPPEMVDKIKAMSDDERRAWFQKQREQRSGSN